MVTTPTVYSEAALMQVIFCLLECYYSYIILYYLYKLVAHGGAVSFADI